MSPALRDTNLSFPFPAGNEHLHNVLERMICGDRIPHAIAFCGQQGCGKFTLAVCFAKMMLCHGLPENERIRIAHLIDEQIHPDVMLYQKNDNGIIPVDSIRDLGRDIYRSPNEGNIKVYLIRNAQDMNEQAQNALLKLIEEPPQGVVFILTCDTPGNLLPTIQSRICAYYLAPVSKKELLQIFEDRQIQTDKLERAYALFGGNVGQCLAYCGQENPQIELAAKVLAYISLDRPADALKVFLKVKSREELQQLLQNVRLCYAAAVRNPRLFLDINVSRLNAQGLDHSIAASVAYLQKNANLNLCALQTSADLFYESRTSIYSKRK